VTEEAAQPSESEKETESAAPPSGGRTASEFRDIADAIRSRTDLFGKTLGAIVGLGTTAVGLNRIGDLFPADGWEWVGVAAACLGLAVAALAAVAIAVRLMNVARPVLMDPDLSRSPEVASDEQEAVKPVYEASARRFGYTSLAGLQERERILREAGSWSTDKDEQARRIATADEVKAEIEQALARGQVVVVRRRSTKAVTGAWAWLFYFLVIAGLISFAVGTDFVSSDRLSVADAKACAEAREAEATTEELRRTGVCESPQQTDTDTDSDAQSPSSAVARAQVTTKLAAALEACVALEASEGETDGGPLDEGECAPLRDAIVAMNQPE
jgi:hypothetical protein